MRREHMPSSDADDGPDSSQGLEPHKSDKCLAMDEDSRNEMYCHDLSFPYVFLSHSRGLPLLGEIDSYRVKNFHAMAGDKEKLRGHDLSSFHTLPFLRNAEFSATLFLLLLSSLTMSEFSERPVMIHIWRWLRLHEFA